MATILNPLTGRHVKRDGKVGRFIINNPPGGQRSTKELRDEAIGNENNPYFAARTREIKNTLKHTGWLTDAGHFRHRLERADFEHILSQYQIPAQAPKDDPPKDESLKPRLVIDRRTVGDAPPERENAYDKQKAIMRKLASDKQIEVYVAIRDPAMAEHITKNGHFYIASDRIRNSIAALTEYNAATRAAAVIMAGDEFRVEDINMTPEEAYAFMQEVYARTGGVMLDTKIVAQYASQDNPESGVYSKSNPKSVHNPYADVESMIRDVAELYAPDISMTTPPVITNIIFKMIQKDGTKGTNRTLPKRGAFLPFIGMDNSLSKYGLFDSADPEYHHYCCLVQALDASGVDEAIMDDIVIGIKKRNVSKPEVAIIAKAHGLNIQVTIRDFDNTKSSHKPATYMHGEPAPKPIIHKLILAGGHYFIDEVTDGTSSYEKLRKAILSGWARPMTPQESGSLGYKTLKHDRDIADGKTALFDDGKWELPEPKDPPEMARYIIAFDVETTTKSDDHKNDKSHVPYMLSYQTLDMEQESLSKITTLAGTPDKIVKEFEMAMMRLRGKTQAYAHNSSYDVSVLFPWLDVKSVLAKGQTDYCFEINVGSYRNKSGKLTQKIVKIFDSMKMLDMPLASIPDAFKLATGPKEIMPYGYFTVERCKKMKYRTKARISDFTRTLHHNDAEAFPESLKASGARTSDTHLSPLAYSRYYCERDVSVLMQGLIKFRDLMLGVSPNVDIFGLLTISSAAEMVLNEEGCFDDVYKIGGSVLEFCGRAVVGGQVHVVNGGTGDFKGEWVSADLNSMYPAAMASMPGLPTGEPIIIDTGSPVYDYDYDSGLPYIAEIRILQRHYDEGHKRNFPQLSELVNGARRWTDNPDCRIHVKTSIDIQTLSECYGWKRGVHYEILRAVEFGGWNKKVSATVKKLYKKRKSTDNEALDLTLKKVLNSSYGKTCLRETEYDTKVVAEEDFAEFLSEYRSNVVESTTIQTANGLKRVVKVARALGNHTNRAHAGAFILSQSKLIISRIHTALQNAGIACKYGDTDSIYMEKAGLAILKPLKNIFGEPLLDKNALGSLSNDFKSKIIKGKVLCDRLVILGKKTLCACLVSADGKQRDYKIVYKGAPTVSIIALCCERKQTPPELYADLLNGAEVKADLLVSVLMADVIASMAKGGIGIDDAYRSGAHAAREKVRFKKCKDRTMRSLTSFTRTLRLGG